MPYLIVEEGCQTFGAERPLEVVERPSRHKRKIIWLTHRSSHGGHVGRDTWIVKIATDLLIFLDWHDLQKFNSDFFDVIHLQGYHFLEGIGACPLATFGCGFMVHWVRLGFMMAQSFIKLRICPHWLGPFQAICLHLTKMHTAHSVYRYLYYSNIEVFPQEVKK